MPAVTYTCPGCNAALRSPNAITAGKKIRCPKCGEAFAVPEVEVDAELDDGIQTRPASRPARRPAEDYDEPPAYDDEPDEAEDRPLRKKKKRKKKQGVSPALLIGGAVLLLAALATGGYFAWDLLSSGRNKGTGNEIPLAYIPAEHDLMAFADVEALLNLPVVGTRVEELFARGNGGKFFEDCKRETGLPFRDLFQQVAFGLPVASAGTPTPPVTIVIKSRVPFDQKKVARSAKDPVAKKHKGKVYYQVSDPGFRYLFMPSDRIIVLFNGPENQLEALISSDGTKPQAAGDAAAMMRNAEGSQFWAVIPITGPFQQQFQMGLTMAAAQADKDQKPLLEEFARTRALGVSARAEGDHVGLAFGFGCPDEAGASRFTEGMQKSWQQSTQSFQFKATMAGIVLAKPQLKDAIKEVLDSTRFESKGSWSYMSARLSLKSLETLAGELQNLPMGQMGQPGFNPGGPGMMPGMPPQGMPGPPGRPGMPRGPMPGPGGRRMPSR